MSTHINNGRILRNCTLADALARLQDLRSEAVNKAQAGVAVRVAELRYYWADMDQNFIPIPRKEYDNFFWRVLDILKEQRMKVEGAGERSVDWDFTFQVLLIPHHEHVLALYYLENNPGFTQLLTQAGFEDYHYQNSTDGPESISQSDWEARCVAWDQAMPSGVPSHAGLKYEMVTWTDIRLTLHNSELILSTRPEEHARRMKVALNLIDPAPIASEHQKMGIFQMAKKAEAMAQARAPHVLLATTEMIHGEQGASWKSTR